MQWEENRQRKAERLKTQLKSAEESELKLKPKLNKHSVRIAAQDARRQQGTVADHLCVCCICQRLVLERGIACPSRVSPWLPLHPSSAAVVQVRTSGTATHRAAGTA